MKFWISELPVSILIVRFLNRFMPLWLDRSQLYLSDLYFRGALLATWLFCLWLRRTWIEGPSLVDFIVLRLVPQTEHAAECECRGCLGWIVLGLQRADSANDLLIFKLVQYARPLAILISKCSDVEILVAVSTGPVGIILVLGFIFHGMLDAYCLQTTERGGAQFVVAAIVLFLVKTIWGHQVCRLQSY